MMIPFVFNASRAFTDGKNCGFEIAIFNFRRRPVLAIEGLVPDISIRIGPFVDKGGSPPIIGSNAGSVLDVDPCAVEFLTCLENINDFYFFYVSEAPYAGKESDEENKIIQTATARSAAGVQVRPRDQAGAEPGRGRKTKGVLALRGLKPGKIPVVP